MKKIKNSWFFCLFLSSACFLGANSALASPEEVVISYRASAVSKLEYKKINKRDISKYNVEKIEEDLPVTVAQATDPFESLQWQNWAPSGQYRGASNLGSLTRTLNTNGLTVAVVDTGSVPDPEVDSKILARYDFISDPVIAGDGGGRDSDATDEGDFCADPQSNSSWHGTRVASILAADRNGASIAGIHPAANLIVARTLGRCGGWLSDVADAVRWAAGGSVSGVPAHGQSVKVINLSLSTPPGVTCPSYMQSAIDFARSRGVVVVAAAGNDGASQMGSPANCTGVVSVAAHTASADLSFYSNYSQSTTVSAPGGGACSYYAGVECNSIGILATTVQGSTVYQGTGASPSAMIGTSAASPIVAGIVALAIQDQPYLTPSQIESYLKNSARPFPADSYCADAPCSFGMVDAQAFIERARDAYALALTVLSSKPAYVPEETVRLTASVESQNPGTLTYTWEQTEGPTVSVTKSQNNLTFVAPLCFECEISFRVTVNNQYGKEAQEDFTVTIQNYSQIVVNNPNPDSARIKKGDPLIYSVNIQDNQNIYSGIEILAESTVSARVENRTLVVDTSRKGNFVVAYRVVDLQGKKSAKYVLNVEVFEQSSGGGGGSMSLTSVLFLIGLGGYQWFLNRKKNKNV